MLDSMIKVAATGAVQETEEVATKVGCFVAQAHTLEVLGIAVEVEIALDFGIASPSFTASLLDDSWTS